METPPLNVCPFYVTQHNPKKSILQGTLSEKITLQNARLHTAGSPYCSASPHSIPHQTCKINTQFALASLSSHYRSRWETHIYAHTVPLTAEIVVEPRHQVEGCVLFRGAFAPC